MSQITPPVAPPSFEMHLGRPYTPPVAWHQVNKPCDCNDCPDCSRWDIFIAPLTLTVDYSGACYSGNGLPVVMPLIGTVTEPWCIKLRSVVTPVSVYAGERMMEGTPPSFVIDGVEYDYFTIPAGEDVCVCFQDGNWLVTGNATGVDEGEM